MYDQHELPGYVTTRVPSSLEAMEFSVLFGACAAVTHYDPDEEDAHLVLVCYHFNVRDPIVCIICDCLGIRPPEERNLISGQGGWGTTSLTRVLMKMMDDAWMAHVRDWAAFEGPSPINITAVRMAGYLWLGWLRVPFQSWKPLTHCTYVDPPICDLEFPASCQSVSQSIAHTCTVHRQIINANIRKENATYTLLAPHEEVLLSRAYPCPAWPIATASCRVKVFTLKGIQIGLLGVGEGENRLTFPAGYVIKQALEAPIWIRFATTEEIAQTPAGFLEQWWQELEFRPQAFCHCDGTPALENQPIGLRGDTITCVSV